LISRKGATAQRWNVKSFSFMTINEISKIVLDAAFEIHKKLGPGLLESVYETIMEYELIHTYRLKVSRQRGIPVVWKEMKLDLGFRSDLIVEDMVLVEFW